MPFGIVIDLLVVEPLVGVPERQGDEAEEDPSAPIELSDSELHGFLFTDEESLKRYGLLPLA